MANDKKIKAGIIGGAGYGGGEMIRLLLNHPNVEISYVHSRSNAGNPLYAVHADLLGETELTFTGEMSNDIDVLFLCLGHGEAKKFVEATDIAASIKIIDLSQDFRLGETVKGREFVYGLPEMQREKIITANNIANPGCFATGIQLGLLPLAKAGLLQEVHTTGITGSTGAGQSLQATSHFTWRANNISTYKVLSHQHLKEIRRSLQLLQPSFTGDVNFVPVRGDFPRGIWVTSYLQSDLSLEEAQQLYKDYYAGHPFTHVSDKQIDLKQIVNTNKCLIQLEKVGNKLVIHSIEDNLLKGASGQAVQNMNLLFGFDETAGLKLKSIVF
ncbi:N-acetyl-gamma-glutamyl-phosphate reductase [Chitinophaga pinensis]|uniref:N-acetyl-gamma-glutamyl-phosphate reductase n=1 Tax=Chitinophaga pinensis (strain ATCC 43595 / DSM 2588 / LMG 13176 / NBRC 15968 / NCIMB 11800 / UQM 2034) TaxID=485918 RepID=A0A979GAT2_CHIPD|nr:N-acetyl-gamma-glutamyl-phosphate reductase [Chitinophaga pinensis]ACU63959.1 N-acetyl-gamma-glutamyl-phosphate reductase [Chitinophaga pinensis DSM 2588]